MNDSKSGQEERPSPEPQQEWIESANAPNVETVIVEGGDGDNTIRPMPDWLRPYIRGWIPRPEKPPEQTG